MAHSEYVSPDTRYARLQLIETIKRVCPLFLEKLSADVFPFYCELARSGYDLDRILLSPTVSAYKALNEGGLKSALSKWVAEFNADDTWLKDEALSVLQGWYVAPEWRQSLRWAPFYLYSSSASTGETFEFSCEGWETELRTWCAYSKSLRRRFKEKLLEYEKKTRKLAESCGLVRARRKYSQDNLDWFVLYQFAGLSSTEIADRWAEEHKSVDDSTVLKGIKAAAQLIGWDHLRAKQGKKNRKIAGD